MIRDALSVLPTRPVKVIVPAIVVLVLSFYYWDRYQKCTAVKLLRATIVESLANRRAPGVVSLGELTTFPWDRVRIQTGVKSRSSDAGCPFDWNWASGQRDALAESGRLTAVIFVRREQMMGYVELNAAEVEFRGVDAELLSLDETFSLTRRADGGVVLTRVK